MVPLVPCRSITTCASRLNYIHSAAVRLIYNGAVPGYLQSCFTRLVDMTSRQRLRSSASHRFGSTASSSVYCRQASLHSFRRQHTTTFHRTSLVTVLHRHSRFSDSVSKLSYFPVHKVGLDAVMRYLNINFHKK